MKTKIAVALLSLSVLASACGGGGGPSTETAPVRDEPLSGTVEQRPFQLAAAIAFPFDDADPAWKRIVIEASERSISCAPNDRALEDGERRIQTIIEWPAAPGSAWRSGDLGGSVNIEVHHGDASSMGAEGRIEIVESSTTAGVVRVRATNELGTVEGRIAFSVCPDRGREP